jgi:TRAP-type C4-dicarboxylate transport system permease large subunit
VRVARSALPFFFLLVLALVLLALFPGLATWLPANIKL